MLLLVLDERVEERQKGQAGEREGTRSLWIASAAPGHTLHRLAERADRQFGLVQQGVSLVRQHVALLDQPACGVPRVRRSPAELRWDELAGKEMLANVHGQVGATARAQVRAVVEEVIGKLVLPEALAASRARHHRVTPSRT